uniref:Ulp1 protease family, C-terminal catalytic domain containing protein n=1 Tax=Solanum tuberosum TaxID=4113 RepID=M1D9V7_SOLTU
MYIDNASVVPENEYKTVGTIKGFGIPVGLSWHLTDEVYVPVNCNGECHWILAVIVLKEQCIKVYDSMSSSRTNRKLCAEIQKLSTMLPKFLESSRFFEQKDRTNWSVLESYQGKNKSHPFEVIHVTGNAQQASNSLYELTVKYLLDPLSPKTNNLFGCPWAFMACTFEAIPHLKHQVTAKEEISSPRIMRWLTAKNVKNSPDLFNPPDDAVSFYITNFKLSYVSNVVTDEAYVATNESFVAANAPYVAIYHPYVATCDTSVITCDPNVVIDDSYVATYHPSIAICDPNVDIDDSYIATDDPFVATRDINIATDAHMLQHYSNI